MSLLKNRGIVIWFTGLSGSGKTTLAESLKKHLASLKKTVAVIDGDVIRGQQHRHLGFSREDIRENNRLIAILAKETTQTNDIVLVPIISPYQEDRLKAKNMIEPDTFIELYINSSLETCAQRDVKRLYQKARHGYLNNLIGVSLENPYEHPSNPDLEINTDKHNIEESTRMILNYLLSRKLI